VYQLSKGIRIIISLMYSNGFVRSNFVISKNNISYDNISYDIVFNIIIKLKQKLSKYKK